MGICIQNNVFTLKSPQIQALSFQNQIKNREMSKLPWKRLRWRRAARSFGKSWWPGRPASTSQSDSLNKITKRIDFVQKEFNFTTFATNSNTKSLLKNCFLSLLEAKRQKLWRRRRKFATETRSTPPPTVFLNCKFKIVNCFARMMGICWQTAAQFN